MAKEAFVGSSNIAIDVQKLFKILDACYRSNDPHFKIQTLKKRAEQTLESLGGLDFSSKLIL
jgi:hypothetical protein